MGSLPLFQVSMPIRDEEISVVHESDPDPEWRRRQLRASELGFWRERLCVPQVQRSCRYVIHNQRLLVGEHELAPSGSG